MRVTNERGRAAPEVVDVGDVVVVGIVATEDAEADDEVDVELGEGTKAEAGGSSAICGFARTSLSATTARDGVP